MVKAIFFCMVFLNPLLCLAQPDRVQIESKRKTFCQDKPKTLECVERLEQWLISQFSEVSRKGEKLIFKNHLNQESLILEDQHIGTDHSVSYRLDNYYLPWKAFGVLVGYWEASGYELIFPNTGEKVWMVSRPIASPSLNKMIAAVYTGGQSFDASPYAVQIFHYENKKVIKAWEGITVGGARNPIWKDENTISITLIDGEEEMTQESQWILRYVNHEWKLEKDERPYPKK